MVFRAGLRDPCTTDVEPQVSVFLRFPKVEQHPKCMDHAILLGKPFGNLIFSVLVLCTQVNMMFVMCGYTLRVTSQTSFGNCFIK
jgi:hypothetical protein